MIPGAHIVLHLGLCSAMLRTPAGTAMTVHVKTIDKTRHAHVNQDFTFKRYGSESGEIEFDSPQGLYQMQITAPQYACGAVDDIYVIADHERTITEQLSDGPPPPQQRPLLMSGTAPQSFLYLQPMYVVFAANTVACDKPVPDPLPSNFKVEDDPDSFYVWMYPDQNLVAHAPLQVALQLQTPTGEEHYIRLKIPFPPTADSPSFVTFDVTDDEVDWLSGQPTGVLLCPRLFRTSAG